MENDPRYMCFKVDFINFFRRTFCFGAILSNRFGHILIGEKIDIFNENCEKGPILYQSYLYDNRVSDQSLGVQNVPLGQAKKKGGNKSENNHFYGTNFVVQNLPFFDFFENF